MKESTVFDSLSIKQIAGIWALGIVAFAILYFSLSFTAHHLSYNGESLTANANGFANSIYFSFITALTIGYNDIVPLGYSKLLVILEAIFSAALFALLIAKIASIEIKHQVEELSFEESTNSAVSELYIFRSDIRNISESVKMSKKVNSEVRNFDQSLSTLVLALTDLDNATSNLSPEKKKEAGLRIGLIASSVNFSLSRMIELLEAFNHRKTNWKKESITAKIEKSLQIAKKLSEKYNFEQTQQDSKIVEKLDDLNKTLQTLQETISKH
ncbi:MAG TPA: potassium channel family protein [Alphaproteobacteria bacterium]|nr:potassium channel family protein [Alphaproteobacteria bacterium]